MPSIPVNKPQPPTTMPQEWQKALEALEAVKPKSGSNENSPKKTVQTATPVDVSSTFEWPNTHTGYPGYDMYVWF